MIKISTVHFDYYTGDILIPRKRVVTYARTDKADVGAQVLPKVGASFTIETIRYETSASVIALVNQLDAMIGTDVAIITGSFNYTTTFSTKFIVENVTTNADEKLVRARGYRNAVAINYSPATLVRTVWKLRSAPV